MTTAVEKKEEDWMTKKWRPMMAIVYMMINLFDFIIGPILYNLLQYWNPGQAVGMWQPLTLQGGGLFHLAFGAILGVSAWTRGQEKVAQINNPPPQDPVMLQQPVMQQPSAPIVNKPVAKTETFDLK
jgi:hypothetical protein